MILQGTRDPLFLDRFSDAHDDSLDTLVPDPSDVGIGGQGSAGPFSVARRPPALIRKVGAYFVIYAGTQALVTYRAAEHPCLCQATVVRGPLRRDQTPP